MLRRELLGAGAALCLVGPRWAWALGEATQVDVVELDVPGSVRRESAWRQLLTDLQLVTSIETADRVVRLPPEDPALFDHPFAVLAGDSAFGPLSDEAVERLRRYLTYGGFLYVDDTSGLATPPTGAASFDASVRRLMRRLFPNRPVAPIPADHSLYRAFFFVHRPVGLVDGVSWLEGVELAEVHPVIYGRNDLSGALATNASGGWVSQPRPGGEAQREEARKLAMNLVMYALTSNYKKDQAHVATLMREGRLE